VAVSPPGYIFGWTRCLFCQPTAWCWSPSLWNTRVSDDGSTVLAVGSSVLGFSQGGRFCVLCLYVCIRVPTRQLSSTFERTTDTSSSDSKGQQDGQARRSFIDNRGGPRKFNDNRSGSYNNNANGNNRSFNSNRSSSSSPNNNNNRNSGDSGDRSFAARGPPSLKLQNPLKAQRVVAAPPPQRERGPRNDEDRGGGQRGPRSNDDRGAGGQRGGPRMGGGPGGQRGPPRSGGPPRPGATGRDGNAIDGGEAGTSSESLEEGRSKYEYSDNNNKKNRGRCNFCKKMVSSKERDKKILLSRFD
jgi:hypothetical protein